MKKLLLPILLVVLFTSCSDSTDKNGNDSTIADTPKTQNDTTVNSDSLLPKDSVPVTPIDSAGKGNSNSNTNDGGRKSKYPLISGTLYYNRTYCGGARPSEEILTEYQKYLPLGNSEIQLKNRSGSFVVSTDQSGNFSNSIAYGTYEIYLLSVMPRIANINQQNCKDCFSKSIGQVTIGDMKKNDIKVTIPCADADKKRP